MSKSFLRALILSILVFSLVCFCGCEKRSPVSVDTDKNGSINQPGIQAGEQAARETGTVVTDNATGAVTNNQAEKSASRPVIDRVEVLLRSGIDSVTTIAIDPNGEIPQPKIEVKSLYTAELTCIARSMKGEPLAYEWQATGGKIYGSGKKITWLAPQAPIIYKITVTVTDSGGSASAPVNISVRCCY